MWPGQTSPYSSGASLSARLALAATTSAPRALRPIIEPTPQANLRPLRCPPSAGSPQPQSNETGERKAHARPSLMRALLAVLCLPILANCSLARLLPQDPAPAVTPCPMVQCLDRALRTCEGVSPPAEGVRSCQDAVLLASDALGEVLVCQQAHAELIRCVEAFNAAQGR